MTAVGLTSRGAYLRLRRNYTRTTACTAHCRHLQTDGRPRLSNIWVPAHGLSYERKDDAQGNLARAGLLTQSQSGIFNLLPLGRRIQDKLVALINKHMRSLGASQVELSVLTSQALWEESGRLAKAGGELFRLKDRKDAQYLLGPTHEEEITSIVARKLRSYKDLPLRLFQTTKKFRDELRPRFGLLRSREFLMKDLYTFDYSVIEALKTYEEVRKVYTGIFNELKLPVRVARGSSGDMGGDMSHEYQIITPLGEDSVISCNKCDYVANEEVAESRPVQSNPESRVALVWRGISQDRTKLVNVWYPKAAYGKTFTGDDVNIHAVKAVCPELDASIKDPIPLWQEALTAKAADVSLPLEFVNLVDGRLAGPTKAAIKNGAKNMHILPKEVAESHPSINLETIPVITMSDSANDPLKPINYLRTQDSDPCPRCENGTLQIDNSLELGHTFYLGTRYSVPLDAKVLVPTKLLEDDNSVTTPPSDASTSLTPAAEKDQTTVPLQMGCHGIGVSRIIGAAANHLSDNKGLNWPRAIAPYEVVVIPPRESSSAPNITTNTINNDDNGTIRNKSSTSKDGEQILDHLLSARFPLPSDIPRQLIMDYHTRLDAVLDDRDNTLPWKMKDADLIGYPVMVVLGREWAASKLVEVQCRRLGVRKNVGVEELPGFVKGLLDQL